MGFQWKIFALDFCFFGDFLRVDGVMNEIKLKLRLEVDQVDAGVDVGVGVEVDQVDLVGMLVRLMLLLAFTWIR